MDFKKVIGIAILIILIYQFKDSFTLILRVNPVLFIFSILSYSLLNLILSYRIHYLLHRLNINTNFFYILRTHLASMILSDITPGRSGYFAFPKFAEKYDIPFNESTAIILSIQAVEMIIKIFGASLAAFYLFSYQIVYSLLIPALITIFSLIYLWTDRIPIRIKRIEKIREYSKISRRYIFEIVFFSISGWFVVAFQWYLIANALRLDLSFFECFLLQPLISMLMFIPLTPAGLGFFEGGSIAFLTLLNIPPINSVAFAILTRLSNVIADSFGIYEVIKSKSK